MPKKKKIFAQSKPVSWKGEQNCDENFILINALVHALFQEHAPVFTSLNGHKCHLGPRFVSFVHTQYKIIFAYDS